MKRWHKILIAIVGLISILVLTVVLLTPWMNRWGATNEEISATYPGDELVPNPAVFLNRAITINASPEQIYPWIVQLDAKKGGWYSYDWLETKLLNCPMTNADRIHPEWQNLQVGDAVDMCPNGVPPAYSVAQIYPNQAIVMGHQENGEWVDLYQFVIVPYTDGTSRLILRTRTMMTGLLWSFIRPGAFVMERGMLLGIKDRAEKQTISGYLPSHAELTPTPEIFNPLDPSPTASAGDLPLTCQITDLNVYIDWAAGYCFAYPLDFALDEQQFDQPSILGPLVGGLAEPVRATFIVRVSPLDAKRSIDQQVDAFLQTFTEVDLSIMTRKEIMVGGEMAVSVDPVPVQLSWRIIFVPHNGYLYRLMYWPVDAVEAQVDLDAVIQTTIGSFAFID